MAAPNFTVYGYSIKYPVFKPNTWYLVFEYLNEVSEIPGIIPDFLLYISDEYRVNSKLTNQFACFLLYSNSFVSLLYWLLGPE